VDTVFETTAVEALDGTTAVAVDRSWQTRYRDRSEENLGRAEKIITEDGSLVTIGTDIPTEDAETVSGNGFQAQNLECNQTGAGNFKSLI